MVEPSKDGGNYDRDIPCGKWHFIVFCIDYINMKVSSVTESSIDKQLNSTYVLHDTSGKVVGSVRAEVGFYEYNDPAEDGSEEVVFIGPVAVAPTHQVRLRTSMCVIFSSSVLPTQPNDKKIQNCTGYQVDKSNRLITLRIRGRKTNRTTNYKNVYVQFCDL